MYVLQNPCHLSSESCKPLENLILLDQRQRHGYAQVLNEYLRCQNNSLPKPPNPVQCIAPSSKSSIHFVFSTEIR